MPLTKLKIKPGIDKENTNYANEGGFYYCDKIRFRSGTAEKLGGWVNQSTYTYKGVTRSLYNWETYTSDNLLGFGTNLKYYIENGGQYYDITPIRSTATLGVDPFATVTSSKVITVTAAGHGAGVGDSVTFSGVSGGGVVNGVTLNGEFEILTVPTGNSYTIAGAAAASGTSSGGGAAVVATYQINAGSTTVSALSGWGAGGWGLGGWGIGTSGSQSTQIRLWSQSKNGQDLLMAYRNGPIYLWVKDVSTYARAGLLSAAANNTAISGVATSTTGTSGGAGFTITLGDATLVDVGSVITGANVPANTTVTAVSGNTITLSASTTGAASGTYTFSYAGMFIPYQVSFILTSDINYFAMVLGANPYDPTNSATSFDPMLVRWSDENNPYQWVPTTFNQSGEQRLSNGSYLVTAANTRQETLIWTDAALYSAQYLGPPYVWGFTMLMDNISIASPNSVITVNNITYWMGTNEFYSYSGIVQTLPCALRHYVFSNLNVRQAAQVICGMNEGFKEIWWHYPSLNSQVNDSYIIFNFLENIWYYGTMNRTAWLDSGIREYVMGAYSSQGTYLSANVASPGANTTTAVIPVLNAYSFPSSGTIVIGSEQIPYTGISSGTSFIGCTRVAGAPAYTAYTPVTNLIPNQIAQHENGLDDVSVLSSPQAINAYIETADFDIGDGDKFILVYRIIPDLTFEGSTVNNPKAYLSIKPRTNPGSAYFNGSSNPTVTGTVSAPIPPNVYPVEQFTGQVYTRVRGRQMAFRIESVDIGVTWQLGAMRFDGRQDGRQ